MPERVAFVLTCSLHGIVSHSQGVLLLSDVSSVSSAPPASVGVPPPRDVLALPFPFFVVSPGRTYIFSASDEDEQATWIAVIRFALEGRAADAAALGAQGEGLWGGEMQLLPVLAGAELVNSTPGAPLLTCPAPR